MKNNNEIRQLSLGVGIPALLGVILAGELMFFYENALDGEIPLWAIISGLAASAWVGGAAGLVQEAYDHDKRISARR